MLELKAAREVMAKTRNKRNEERMLALSLLVVS